jgi:hypothetical protein
MKLDVALMSSQHADQARGIGVWPHRWAYRFLPRRLWLHSWRKALIEIAAEYARRFLPETVADDLDACAALALRSEKRNEKSPERCSGLFTERQLLS